MPTPAAAARLLEDLVDHNLVIQHLPGRYRLHDLIRLHARALSVHEPVPARAGDQKVCAQLAAPVSGRSQTTRTAMQATRPAGAASAEAPPQKS